jgi:hypothetical protein
MYSRAFPLDNDIVLRAQLQIDIIGTKYPMHLDSLNILKTIGRIRLQCGVLVITTFHM